MSSDNSTTYRPIACRANTGVLRRLCPDQQMGTPSDLHRTPQDSRSIGNFFCLAATRDTRRPWLPGNTLSHQMVAPIDCVTLRLNQALQRYLFNSLVRQDDHNRTAV